MMKNAFYGALGNALYDALNSALYNVLNGKASRTKGDAPSTYAYTCNPHENFIRIDQSVGGEIEVLD